jgi:hypothetical protein
MDSMGEQSQVDLTVQRIEREFPGLKGTAYRIISAVDKRYNCHDFAVHDLQRWHDHNKASPLAWPPGVPTNGDVASYRARYQYYGFVESSGDYDPQFEQVAVFGREDGTVEHSARRIGPDLWASKLGKGHDIEHELQALQGMLYGAVLFYMKRPKKVLAPESGR